MTDSKSRCVVEISTDTRPIVYLTIDRLSTDYQPTIDRLLTDYRPTVDRLSTDYRPTIDRLSTDYLRVSTDYRPLYRPSVDRLSTAISTDRSVDTPYSRHDPTSVRKVVSSIPIWNSEILGCSSLHTYHFIYY